jgi:hypothetical protein
VKQFLLFFTVQLLAYSLITYNYRSIAGGHLTPVLVTDALNASLTFFVIRRIDRRIAKSEDSTVGWLGYVCGSLVGTAIGMYL